MQTLQEYADMIILMIYNKKRNPTDINNDNINVNRILLYLQY